MYVATGYKKWGMTTSHVAAKIISDDILGKENKYASIYSATRLQPIKNSKAFGEILNQTVYSLAINKMRKPKLDYTEIQNNCGGIVNYKGKHTYTSEKKLYNGIIANFEQLFKYYKIDDYKYEPLTYIQYDFKELLDRLLKENRIKFHSIVLESIE